MNYINKRLDELWEDICKIHLLTKHYLLLGEEISDENDMFLQPLKEHRDAYDHIIRVYGADLNNNITSSINKYKIDNMIKAIGHEYRAYFDTADWLSMICRRKIRLLVMNYNSAQKFPEYLEAKEQLLLIPEKIAQLREEKDIGNNKALIKEVEQYSLILDSLLDINKRLSFKIFNLQQ